MADERRSEQDMRGQIAAARRSLATMDGLLAELEATAAADRPSAELLAELGNIAQEFSALLSALYHRGRQPSQE